LLDDILLTENDLTEIQYVKDCLLQQFRIKDLGDLKYFLGIEFFFPKLVFTSLKKICALYFAGYRTHMCSSRQISNGTIPKTHTRRWRVIKESSQIQTTRGTVNIPHG